MIANQRHGTEFYSHGLERYAELACDTAPMEVRLGVLESSVLESSALGHDTLHVLQSVHCTLHLILTTRLASSLMSLHVNPVIMFIFQKVC